MKSITKISKKMGLTIFLLSLFVGTSSAKVFINEVSGTNKWIELYNDGSDAVDLTNYTIVKLVGGDDDGTLDLDWTSKNQSFTFGSGTELAAKDFRAWTQDEENSFTWGISPSRDVAFQLLDSLGNEVDFFEIRISALGKTTGSQSVGRETDGAETLMVFNIPTKGATNVTPPPPAQIFEIYVNEVSGNDKWIELYNAENTTVNLTGYTIVKFVGGDDKTDVNDEEWVSDNSFTFGSGTEIGAKSFRAWTQNETNSFTWGISPSRDVAFKLLDPLGDEVDFFEIRISALGKTTGSQSVGRETDGASKLIVFDTPTKGASNGAPPPPPSPIFEIYVNEVSGNDKWFELYNDENIVVDLLGYRIEKFVGGNDDGTPDQEWLLDKSWTFGSDIAGGTEIAAKGFRAWTSGESGSFTWGISAKRDVAFKIYNAQGVELDFMEIRMSARLESDGDGKSVGRKIDGSDELVVFTGVTKGSSNNNGVFLSTKTLSYDDNFTVYLYENNLHLTNQIKTLSIFNLLGAKILSRSVTEQTISISHLPQGIYLVQLTDNNNKTKTQKIIRK